MVCEGGGVGCVESTMCEKTAGVWDSHVLCIPNACSMCRAKYGIIKRLDKKTLYSFSGSDAFLRIQGAVRERLVTLTMSVPLKKLKEDGREEGPFRVSVDGRECGWTRV